MRLQGIQSYTTIRKKALPGISHAHCPQTLIPHMPVPPQESAPSLSPRQSFGCQSPLPWVTGTDRTRSLGLYGSYRVPSRSSLLPLCTLSPGGVTHRPTSLTQSNTAWSQQHTGKTDTGLPKSVQQSQDDLMVMISEQGLHAQASSSFPQRQGFFH
jgi:hypothetical protein